MRNVLDVVLVGLLSYFFVMFLKSDKPGQYLQTMEVKQKDIAGNVANDVKVKQDLVPPDLSIQPPTQLYIEGKGDQKKLRFDTTFVNLGPGPLEIIGHSQPNSDTTYATQYVSSKNGPGEYREIGGFTHHPTHNHWHVTNHVRYELWTITAEGKLGNVVSDTGKMSFCIWDQHSNDLKLENAPKQRVYLFTCGRNTQGMSIGWGDTYEANVDDQELDISKLNDGEYMLTFEVNPDQKMLETDYSNNRGMMRLRIEGNKLTRL